MLELSEKDTKTAVTTMFYEIKVKSLEMNGKIVSAKKQKKKMENLELKNTVTTTKPYGLMYDQATQDGCSLAFCISPA